MPTVSRPASMPSKPAMALFKPLGVVVVEEVEEDSDHLSLLYNVSISFTFLNHLSFSSSNMASQSQSSAGSETGLDNGSSVPVGCMLGGEERGITTTTIGAHPRVAASCHAIVIEVESGVNCTSWMSR